MKQVGVLTATRSEFGLLKPLIVRMLREDSFETRVLVTGAHLSEEFGYTYKEISEAGIPISAKIECVKTAGDSPRDVSDNMARAITGFAEYFEANPLDMLIVLGDRYETLAVCIAAMNARIPIAHIHGGETTEGAIDEAARHSITKMSLLHFPCTEIYRKRIIQMGEDPDRVFNVGALAVENVLNTDYVSIEDLSRDLEFDLNGEYGVVTYHPITLEQDSGLSGFEAMMQALDEFTNMKFIITKANADTGGRKINSRIDEIVSKKENMVAVTSLGVRRYLSAVRGAAVVIGNSSSGVIEVPCLHVPTVNIGHRQGGRILPDSVICCEPNKKDIVNAIKRSVSPEFVREVKAMTNPFGDGHASELIVSTLKKLFSSNEGLNIMKKFYDIDY